MNNLSETDTVRWVPLLWSVNKRAVKGFWSFILQRSKEGVTDGLLQGDPFGHVVLHHLMDQVKQLLVFSALGRHVLLRAERDNSLPRSHAFEFMEYIQAFFHVMAFNEIRMTVTFSGLQCFLTYLPAELCSSQSSRSWYTKRFFLYTQTHKDKIRLVISIRTKLIWKRLWQILSTSPFL